MWFLQSNVKSVESVENTILDQNWNENIQLFEHQINIMVLNNTHAG